MTRTVKKLPTEDQEQIRLATWLAKQGIDFFAIPNGGSRNMLEAVKLKRTGVKSGVPDLCVPIPSGSYHGLYIELKRQKGGKVSENQARWLSLLRDNGYYAEIALGCEEAKKLITYYLALTKPAA